MQSRFTNLSPPLVTIPPWNVEEAEVDLACIVSASSPPLMDEVPVNPEILRAPLSMSNPPAVAAPLMVDVAEVEVAYMESMVSLPVPAMSPLTSKTVPGDEVPMPTLPHPVRESIEKIGVVAVEVAMEKAFTALLIVVVARTLLKSTVNVAPDEVANMMLSNSLTPPWARSPPAVMSNPPAYVEVAVEYESNPAPLTVSPRLDRSPVVMSPPLIDEVPVKPEIRRAPESIFNPPAVAAPENVEVAVVEVALKVERESSPAITAPPCTPRVVPGVVVERPILPAPVTTKIGLVVDVV